MIRVYTAILIWCIINYLATFIFYYYGNNFLGSAIFLFGALILSIVGLFQAHKEDNVRNKEL